MGNGEPDFFHRLTAQQQTRGDRHCPICTSPATPDYVRALEVKVTRGMFFVLFRQRFHPFFPLSSLSFLLVPCTVVPAKAIRYGIKLHVGEPDLIKHLSHIFAEVNPEIFVRYVVAPIKLPLCPSAQRKRQTGTWNRQLVKSMELWRLRIISLFNMSTCPAPEIRYSSFAPN